MPANADDLEELTWIVISRTSPSPILGWPETLTQKAVSRLTALLNDADCECFSPLFVNDFKNIFTESILAVPERKACWCRGNKIERFRNNQQEASDLLRLGDPSLERACFEELKAFFDITEIGSGDGRYSDALSTVRR